MTEMAWQEAWVDGVLVAPLDQHIDFRGKNWTGHGTIYRENKIDYEELKGSGPMIIGGAEFILEWRPRK
jgi:hypothetical protein